MSKTLPEVDVPRKFQDEGFYPDQVSEQEGKLELEQDKRSQKIDPESMFKMR